MTGNWLLDGCLTGFCGTAFVGLLFEIGVAWYRGATRGSLDE